jgi:phosphopantothenoylcysteine decarboxylase/phosphopantothenate--cysteine ligase
MLKEKAIVLGVTGSIASYKAADLASKLVQAGAILDVILTREALHFLTPLTFQSLTHRPVTTDLFSPTSELAMDHVALAERAELIVVAPATANCIAKVANGLADDALTSTILATRAPVLMAPAMDAHMWDNAATQDNIARLQARGVTIVGPVEGRLASGLRGKGRMVEPVELLGHIRALLGRNGDLRDHTIVVSAGGTQEPIDPVRIISNRSSGKMGYAIAEAARDRGAKLVLVAAPTALPDPPAVETVHVQTVAQMREAVLSACQKASAVIMAAAVSDYRPAQTAAQKIKKSEGGLTLQLVKNPDFFLEVPRHVLRVGFAAESEDLVENARKKLVEKELDLIVANDITEEGSGFGTDTNRVVLLDRQGKPEYLPLLPKYDVAHRILDRVVALLKARR